MFDEKQAESIVKSLKVLSLSKLAEEMYSKEEREQFFFEFRERVGLANRLRDKIHTNGITGEDIKRHLDETRELDRAVQEHRNKEPILGELTRLANIYS